MKIAHLSSVTQPVPLPEYGGTQRTIAQMASFQAATHAHNVSVYCPADSDILMFAQQIAEDLGLMSEIDHENNAVFITNADGRVGSVFFHHTGDRSSGYTDPEEANKTERLINRLYENEKKNPYDIIHSHFSALTADFLLPMGLGFKTVTHQHSNNLPKNYGELKFPIICISEDHAERMRTAYDANVQSVVYHGMDMGRHHLGLEHAGYLAWLGRFLPEKGTHRAIEIAQRSGKPLIIAGTVYDKKPDSLLYFNEEILPYITHSDPEFLNRTAGMNADTVREEIRKISDETGVENPVIFVGPAQEHQKQTLFGNALGTLFSIKWAEPFGLVMIESMACGAPVIAPSRIDNIACGSVNEIIQNDLNGFCLDASSDEDFINQSVRAVAQLETLDRQAVRENFEKNWSSERVAAQLDVAYRALIEQRCNINIKPKKNLETAVRTYER